MTITDRMARRHSTTVHMHLKDPRQPVGKARIMHFVDTEETIHRQRRA